MNAKTTKVKGRINGLAFEAESMETDVSPTLVFTLRPANKPLTERQEKKRAYAQEIVDILNQ